MQAVPCLRTHASNAPKICVSGSNALSELKALSKIIQDSINSIEATLTANDLEFPSPYTPFTPESDAARAQPEVAQASALIISAAYQLINSVRSPTLTIIAVATQVCTGAYRQPFTLMLSLCSGLSRPVLASLLLQTWPRL